MTICSREYTNKFAMATTVGSYLVALLACIAPAAADHHGEAGKQSEGYRIFIESCPMQRQGDPELDMGPLAWFLCSDACRYLTGHTFMADGGAFMWA